MQHAAQHWRAFVQHQGGLGVQPASTVPTHPARCNTCHLAHQHSADLCRGFWGAGSVVRGPGCSRTLCNIGLYSHTCVCTRAARTERAEIGGWDNEVAAPTQFVLVCPIRTPRSTSQRSTAQHSRWPPCAADNACPPHQLTSRCCVPRAAIHLLPCGKSSRRQSGSAGEAYTHQAGCALRQSGHHPLQRRPCQVLSATTRAPCQLLWLSANESMSRLLWSYTCMHTHAHILHWKQPVSVPCVCLTHQPSRVCPQSGSRSLLCSTQNPPRWCLPASNSSSTTKAACARSRRHQHTQITRHNWRWLPACTPQPLLNNEPSQQHEPTRDSVLDPTTHSADTQDRKPCCCHATVLG